MPRRSFNLVEAINKENNRFSWHLNLEIDSEGRIRTQHYDTRDDFNLYHCKLSRGPGRRNELGRWD
jgi:hypothetical protein